MTGTIRLTLAASGLIVTAAIASFGGVSARRDVAHGDSGNTAAPAASLRLTADVSDRRLSIYSGDERVRSYMVAVGTAKYPTPRGTYEISKIIWNPGWVPPDSPWAKGKTSKPPGHPENPMKLVKIFFKEPTYYIHGTDSEESLGSAASHGCIRMEPSEAAEVARYLMDHGGEPREESWFERILKRRGETHVVTLRTPITITITD
jgi:lipoprotein-anchoring transpeptidase ErfK/SrfK